MSLKEHYEKLLSATAWLGAAIYTVPGVVLLVCLVIFDVPTVYCMPSLLWYVVGVFSHQLSWGFQAINAQIHVSTEYAVGEVRARCEPYDVD